MIRTQSVPELIIELNDVDESEDLEAKACGGDDVGKSVYETICALSNEPDLGGGTILLGVEKELELFAFYTPKGVTALDKLTSDIASACNTIFSQPIRVGISVEKVGNASVLRIDVPEVPNNQKPIYFKAQALPRGAYRRIGSSDVRCSDEDLQTFFQGKAKETYDARIVPGALWDDIDPAAISAYRRARGEANPLAEELHWSDEDMLHALGAIQRLDGRVQVTATGLLAFGKASALRRVFPTHRVDYIRMPGKIWVEKPDAGFDALDIRGPIITIVGRLLAAIADDLPKTLVIGDSLTGQRTETAVVPLRVIREAVVNALMHRSYEVFHPVQIVRYSNRIEITNPGYSLKSQDRFSEPGSFLRNPKIAEILHETRLAETKGSGIRVMQEKMQQSGLAAPAFESDRENQAFKATFLFHHFLDQSDWDWLAQFKGMALTEDQMRAIVFVREVQAIDNAAYRGLTGLDTLAASKSLRALVRSGLLKDKGSGAKTHYVPGAEMERRAGQGRAKGIHDKRDIIDGAIHDKSLSMAELPERLRTSVRMIHLQPRLRPDHAKAIVLRLCDWRPLSLTEIARLMDRTPAYVSQRFVGPLVAEGKLAYKFPEMIQHPEQKYITVAKAGADAGDAG